MSIEIISLAFDAKIKDPFTKFVLVKLADHANEDGECFPSYGFISRQTSLSLRTVKRKVAELVDLGFLKKIKRFNGPEQTSNLYVIDISALVRAVKGKDVVGVTESPPPVSQVHPGSVTESPPPVSQVHPNHHNEPSMNHTSSNEVREQADDDFYLTKKKRRLKGKRLESFNRFWEAFGYKDGKADAADAWLDIPQLTGTIVEQICKAAEEEAKSRPDMKQAGLTPKMAQGWLSSRRWEDEKYTKQHGQANGEQQKDYFFCVECKLSRKHGGNCDPSGGVFTRACSDIVHISPSVQQLRFGYGVVNSGGVIVPHDIVQQVKEWRRENKKLWSEQND